MNDPGGSFLLEVDLESFHVAGNPRPRAVHGVVAAISGHLAYEADGDHSLDRLVSAYRRHGNCLSAHLLGQYAAVIVDRPARKVLLTQDSLGVRQLFFRRTGGCLVAAADLETLTAFLWPIPLDEAYFADYMARGQRAQRRTPFTGIERLAKGAALSIEPSRRIELRPWRPPSHEQQPQHGEAEGQLRTLLDDAVCASLPETGPVLCELSGGLDSTSVLATASKLGADIQAVTIISSHGLAGDDESYARQAVDALGVRWHQLDFDLYPPYSAPLSDFIAEPIGMRLAQLRAAYGEVVASTRANVVLTGMAGDLVFGNGGIPPFHISDPLASGHLMASIREARRWPSCTVEQRPWTYWFAHFGVRPAWRYLRHQCINADVNKAPGWLSPKLATYGGLSHDEDVAPRLKMPSQQYLWDEVYDQAFAQGSDHRLPPNADARHPLFHRPLVEYMLSLPPSFRRGPSGDRVLQRRALADRLPEAVITRSTKGSSQQLQEHALMDSDTWYRTLTDDSRLVDRGWVDPRRWHDAITRARFGVMEAAPQMDAAMTTEYWLRSMEANPPSPPAELLEARLAEQPYS
jgi:asparagine synthase (glutamine-hydrolysing)